MRKYDDDIGRFLSVDPLWEKYRGWSSYQYGLSNPVRLTDYSGKTVDMDDFLRTEKEEGYENGEKSSALITDLDDKTGAPVAIVNGYVVRAQGPINPQSSPTARERLFKAIESNQTYRVNLTQWESESGQMGGRINLGYRQIQTFIKGAKNVDETTMGWAMTFFHELVYKQDNIQDEDETVSRVNIILQELTDRTGRNFGQRGSYNGELRNVEGHSNGVRVIPMYTGTIYDPQNEPRLEFGNARDERDWKLPEDE